MDVSGFGGELLTIETDGPSYGANVALGFTGVARAGWGRGPLPPHCLGGGMSLAGVPDSSCIRPSGGVTSSGYGVFYGVGYRSQEGSFNTVDDGLVHPVRVDTYLLTLRVVYWPDPQRTGHAVSGGVAGGFYMVDFAGKNTFGDGQVTYRDGYWGTALMLDLGYNYYLTRWLFLGIRGEVVYSRFVKEATRSYVDVGGDPREDTREIEGRTLGMSSLGLLLGVQL